MNPRPSHHSLRAVLCCSIAMLAAPDAHAHERFEPSAAREQLHATLWMQTAPEYRAIAEQTYRLATAALPRLAQPGTAAIEQRDMGPSQLAALPTAIVVDLDETVLDNSWFQARLLLAEREYDEAAWQAWLQEAAATAVPGAKEFLTAASAAGHRIFYVTNRRCVPPAAASGAPCAAKLATQRNLQALGLPGADDPQRLMLRDERPEWSGSDKSSRRAAVASTHRIVALFGDDLGDFMSRTLDAASRVRLQALFGDRWFMLPNAMYGSWERAIADPACPAETPPGECAGRVLERKYATLRATPPAGDAALSGPDAFHLWKQGRTLRVATWNLEYLVEPSTYAALARSCVAEGGRVGGAQRRLPCNTVGRLDRDEADFAALRRYARALDADVVALQEVDGPGAASLVFPGYEFCFTTRPNLQKNGFAIRRGLPFKCEPEYRELSLDDRFRRGVVITLLPGSADEMRLMSVHLKSGCPEGPLSDTASADCVSLSMQTAMLEQWIDVQARAGRRFAVAGDFNRRFARERGSTWEADGRRRNLWPEIDDRDPPGADLVASTQRQPFRKCIADDPYDSYVSHVVLGRDLARRLVPNSWIRVTYELEDAKRHALSDHCPVGVELRLDADGESGKQARAER